MTETKPPTQNIQIELPFDMGELLQMAAGKTPSKWYRIQKVLFRLDHVSGVEIDEDTSWLGITTIGNNYYNFYCKTKEETIKEYNQLVAELEKKCA